MKLSVCYHSGTRHDIVAGKHRIVTDQPVEDGGLDAGPSPVELFIGSVASCVAYFVGRFCARHGIAADGLNVEAEWAMAEQPHRVGHIHLSVHLPHPISPHMNEKLLKVASGCTVHQSLMIAPTVDIKLTPHSPSTVHRS
ncbi:MAG TPA: OsmC family protein [Nitrospira sp.]|jgi:uncharacterized OsmC-like protein|nr:OsmC family protein [Nitrospira sp.]